MTKRRRKEFESLPIPEGASEDYADGWHLADGWLQDGQKLLLDPSFAPGKSTEEIQGWVDRMQTEKMLREQRRLVKKEMEKEREQQQNEMYDVRAEVEDSIAISAGEPEEPTVH